MSVDISYPFEVVLPVGPFDGAEGNTCDGPAAFTAAFFVLGHLSYREAVIQPVRMFATYTEK